MRFQLDKGEFFENKHIRAIPDESVTWWVCNDYEVKESSKNEEEALLYPKYSRGPQKDKWREYKPLQDTPDLFLRFAKLHEKGCSVESAREWARRYGLLGYTPDIDLMAEEDKTSKPSWELFRRAPRAGENLKDGAVGVFWEEVSRAAGVLTMYEATLSRDNEVAKKRLLEELPFLGGRIWWPVAKHLPLFEEDRDLESSLVTKWVEEGLGGDYLKYCLWTALMVVEGTVNDFCYPMLHWGQGSNEHDPSQVVDVWGFENLLGAMYLQMYWLMGSGVNTTRCEWCGRLISLESPYPGAKQRPSHKRFCDKYCRQKWNYHNRVKLRRKGEEPLA